MDAMVNTVKELLKEAFGDDVKYSLLVIESATKRKLSVISNLSSTFELSTFKGLIKFIESNTDAWVDHVKYIRGIVARPDTEDAIVMGLLKTVFKGNSIILNISSSKSPSRTMSYMIPAHTGTTVPLEAIYIRVHDLEVREAVRKIESGSVPIH